MPTTKIVRITARLLFVSMSVGLLSVSCKNKSKQSEKGEMVLVTGKAIPVKNGWGYVIYAGNKVYIRQDNIPQMDGNHVFNRKEDALKAAEMVISKLKAGQLPSLDTSEMKKEGIQL